MTTREHIVTIEEFEEYIARPANADRVFELIDGEIVEKLPTEEHSLIVGNIYAALREFARPRNLGRAAFEVRRQVQGDQHNARLPDVEFTSAARLLPVVRKGAVPQMPDLAVEVKSPTDTFISMREKAIYYLKNGAQVVWLVFPDKREVEVHTTDATVKTLGIDGVLDGGDVLPEFTLAVKDVFEV